MRWRHFAAGLGYVQRGRNRHSRIQRDSQRLRHLLQRPLHSNENNNKLPNDKPWFNTYIKHKLQAKQDAYKDNDKDKYNKARYAAEKPIKTSKAKCPDKLEDNLHKNNTIFVYGGV